MRSREGTRVYRIDTDREPRNAKANTSGDTVRPVSSNSAPLGPTTPPLHIPPADASSVYCTLYHRDDGFTELAEAELHALGGGHSAEPGVWLSPRPIAWNACGYGIAGGRQLAAAETLDELERRLRALQIVAPRFCLTTRRIPKSRKGATPAKILVGNCITGNFFTDAPDLRLLLVVSATGYRVLVDDAPGEPEWLRARHKPHNYMVALPVRMAQAMLNLTLRPGDTVYDPFCGSGTIPLLAAWAGHRAFGSDIGAACVSNARENIAHFGQHATLSIADAARTTTTADCIVSNLPYGLLSHFAPDAKAATLRHLATLAPRQTLVTSERIEDDLTAAGYRVTRIIAVESSRFERFVYLTQAQRGTSTTMAANASTTPR